MRKRKASTPSRDASKGKRMSEELKVSGNEFLAWFNLLPDFVAIVDEKGKILAVNDAAEKVGGFKRKEFVGKNFLTADILTSKSKAVTVKNLAKRMIGARIRPYEIELVTRDGEKKWGEVSATKIKYKGRPANLAVFRDITERKKMEQRIRTFTQFLSAAVNDSPDLIFIKDKDLRYVVVSDVACDFAGRPREEIVGRTAQDLYPKDFADSVERTDREVLEKGAVVDVPELRSVRGEEPRTFHTRKSPLRDASGNITHIISITRDVTEHKRMEETLKQSEVKLKALHRHARTLSVAKSIEEVAKHTLDAMEFTLGFDVADFCAVENEEIHVYGSRGVQVSPSRWPLDGPGVVVKSVKAKRTLRIPDTKEEPSFVDRRGFCGTQELQPMFSELAVPVLKDDEAVAVLNVESSRLNAFTDEDRELLETLAMHVASALGRLKQVDALERLVEDRARELKVSEEKYRRLVDNTTDVVFTLDLKGNFTFCSPAAKMMTGYSVQQLLSTNMKELIAPEHFPEIQERLQARIQGERYLPPHQFEIIKADGKRIPVEMTTTRVVEKGTLVGIQGIARDITERRQMEKKLREAERLAAIGETTAMVGHDLRNPLTGITGAVYILKTISNMKKDSKAKEFLDLIERNVEYSNKIISDLLDYSAELHLNLTATNPKSIIADALRFIPIPENTHVTDLSRNDTQLIADAEKLRRVAVNLITNAVDAMPEGGTLTISVRQSNGDVEIAFSDTGTGMTKEAMENLWTPLFTTKAKGMGFGLPIVRRIVEAHGGSVFVESIVGKGSTFKVKLPIKPELKEVNRT